MKVLMLEFLPLYFIAIEVTVTCPSPVAPDNGEVSFDGTEIGSTAIYTCDSGFELVGEASAICTETGDGNSGSFQPDAPTCQRKYQA